MSAYVPTRREGRIAPASAKAERMTREQRERAESLVRERKSRNEEATREKA